MPTVWVVNFAGHNYQEAERWGEIKYITIGYISQGSLDRLIYSVVTKLKDSKPDDFILPSGLLVLNVLAGILFWHRHKRLNLLVWDRKNSTYRELKTTPDHLSFLLGATPNQGEPVADLQDKDPESPG